VHICTYPITVNGVFHLDAPVSFEDVTVEMDSQKDIIVIQSASTQQKHEYSIRDFNCPHAAHTIKGNIVITDTSISKTKKRPTVYIGKQKLLSLGEVDAFWYNSDDMLLYTLVQDSEKVKEYTLFDLVSMGSKGVGLLYPTRTEVYGKEQRLSLITNYAPGSLVSLRLTNDGVDILFSLEDDIIHGHQIKKCPHGFMPDKIHNSAKYIYLYSQQTEELLVLNKSLTIEHTLVVTGVFFTNDYVFMQKENQTVVHYADTFTYAFFLTEMPVDLSCISASLFSDSLYVFINIPVVLTFQ
jgi:hypothetical protein